MFYYKKKMIGKFIYILKNDAPLLLIYLLRDNK